MRMEGDGGKGCQGLVVYELVGGVRCVWLCVCGCGCGCGLFK